ncbi:MAG: hypothetical protein U0263_01215 [Polyangiaceae bacterium]
MRFVHVGDDREEAEERRLFFAHVDEVLTDAVTACVEADWEGVHDTLREAVARVHAGLDVDLLSESDGARLVVMTPRGERRLRPLAAAVVARMNPAGGVRFASLRPPRSFAETCEDVRRELGFDLTRAHARAGFARGHLLDLVLYAEGWSAADENAVAAAERAVEGLLGERVLDDWVSRVDVEARAPSGPLRVIQKGQVETFPLVELPQAVAAAVEGLSGELPDISRLGVLREGWVLFEAEPEASTDYAAQDDVALAASALPEMLKCYLEGAPFSSLRFVRGGAKLAYLKIDAQGVSYEDRVRERARLEDELSAALAPSGLGAVVGNGLGLRYAYVDLALAPNPAAWDIVCEVARAAGASKRSWIQFFDSDLADEWLGVWPNTPRPPGLG